MKNKIIVFICSLFCWSFTVAAAMDSTKGIMLNSARIDSSSVVAARLSDLSPSAIEKGLKDVQLLAKPTFDQKSKVFTMEWHSITKTINGTEHSKTLTEPLGSQLKLQAETVEIPVGQSVTIKGDLESLIDDFDVLLRDAKSTTEINSEKNVDASITNEGENDASNKGSDIASSSGNGGYLSEGGLTENNDLEDGGISVDEISSTTQACALNVDWSTMNAFMQERVIKTSNETGETTDIGECYNIGQANKIEKDYSSTCNIQINGEQSYVKGFLYYSFLNGERVELSGCQYESSEAEPLLVKHDFEACNLSFAETNLAENKYYPAAVKFTMINGTRYNLTECEVIQSASTPLPTRAEVCEVEHSIDEMTSFTMKRIDVYDPSDSELLKTGDCERHISFPIMKDYEAGCSIRFNNDETFIKGFQYYSNISNKRHDISSCEYDESELQQANVIKDFDSCSLDYAEVNAEQGNYHPAFVKYTLIDGERFELSGCETSIEDIKPLPLKTEVCELEHSIPELKTYRMERIDTYDPANRERLIEGDCYSIEEIAIQRDFDAGCSIQIDSTFNNYTRGFKYFSTVDSKKYTLSECEYNGNDAVAYDSFKDYSICDLELAVVDLQTGKYQPAFVTYTLIDGVRYDLAACANDVKDIRDLPVKTETCEMSYDYENLIAHDMERIDTYDPKNEHVMKSSDCYSVKEYPILKDYQFDTCLDLPDYNTNKIALGYKHFYQNDEKDYYIGNCEFDFTNKKDMFQIVDTCKASENLTTSSATINKKWYYNTESGERVFITDCLASSETYPIVNTSNTCSPQYIASTGEVVVQHRKGWQDKDGVWHYSTNCEPSDQTTNVLKEWCTSPEYEHDFVGGQSYRRSRNYYNYEGNKVYINGCSRDSVTSYSHYKTTSGCTVDHDDSNLRSRLYEKTMANLHSGTTQLKGCAASSNYVPYTYVSVGYQAYAGLGGATEKEITNIFQYPSQEGTTTYCNLAKTQWSYVFDEVIGDINTKEKWCNNQGCYHKGTVRSEYKQTTYRRHDGSTYKLNNSRVCRGL